MPLDGNLRRQHAARQAAPALVPYQRWQTACERVSAALLSGERLVLVTGPAGTGKSLLLEQVTKVMRAAGWSTVLRQADTSPSPPGETLLMVDEADRIASDALRRLVVTTEGPLVLAGLDSLAARLPKATRIALPALSREEARDYIAHWLALSGRSPANLETAGMRRLVELSGGVPRLISTLLAAAAWLAESAGESVMTQLHIEESSSLRSSLSPHEAETPMYLPPAPRPRRIVSAVLPTIAAMLLLGAGAFLAGRYFPDELREAAGGTGRMIAEWQGRLQGRVGAARHDVAPQPTLVAEVPRSAEPASPSPPPLPAAAVPAVEQPAVPVSPPPSPPTLAAPPSPPPIEADAQPPAVAAPALSSPAIVASAAAAETAAPLSRETIDILLHRGHEMLLLGDVSAARLLFGRAADAGSADAMLAMGETYDPTILAQSKLLTPADRDEAGRWYRRSAAAGNPQADLSLARMSH